MAHPARHRFHEELEALEREIVRESELAQRAIRRAVDGLVRRDAQLADAVIAEDDAVDDVYIDIERRVFDLIARQTPVASDLRLVTAITHINVHLERVGDMAVNIAKIVKATTELPASDVVLSHIEEMASVTGEMLRTATDAFVGRDLDLCLRLPKMDDPVDRLNRQMLREVLALSRDERRLEWGLQMHMVARQLERVGDHAVDIGEQVGFLLTGEFREFTDASHPVDVA